MRKTGTSHSRSWSRSFTRCLFARNAPPALAELTLVSDTSTIAMYGVIRDSLSAILCWRKVNHKRRSKKLAEARLNNQHHSDHLPRLLNRVIITISRKSSRSNGTYRRTRLRSLSAGSTVVRLFIITRRSSISWRTLRWANVRLSWSSTQPIWWWNPNPTSSPGQLIRDFSWGVCNIENEMYTDLHLLHKLLLFHFEDTIIDLADCLSEDYVYKTHQKKEKTKSFLTGLILGTTALSVLGIGLIKSLKWNHFK